MHFQSSNGVTHILLDEGESEIQALISIVKASFSGAEVDPDLSTNDTNYELSNEEALHFIRPSPRIYDGLIVEMTKVDGRTCDTVVYKIADGHFSLYDHYYQRFRGEPAKMLARANEILRGSLTRLEFSEK